MNFTITLLLLPLSMWTFTYAVPPNATAVINASLPPICNATGVYTVSGPAAFTIACVNPSPKPHVVRGGLEIKPMEPKPPQLTPPEPPLFELAIGVTAAAGLSHVLSNRRELLLAPAVWLFRVKTAKAESPERKKILQFVEKMGAATLAQIAKAVGKSWGSTQWHVYVLEREGKLKSVKIGSFTYYYTNPQVAAEVILSSIDPQTLSPEDREKLEFMAS